MPTYRVESLQREVSSEGKPVVVGYLVVGGDGEGLLTMRFGLRGDFRVVLEGTSLPPRRPSTADSRPTGPERGT